jgi:peptide/nickel transport system substrate-binding protein
MSHSPRCLLAARLFLTVVFLGGLLCVGWVSGQGPTKKPPRTEDEDDPSKTGKVVHHDDNPKGPGSDSGEAQEVDLVVAMSQPGLPTAVRDLFKELAVPHDEFHFQSRVDRVQPIPDYVGSDVKSYRGSFHLIPIDPKDKPYNPTTASVLNVQHYESIAYQSVKAFLDRHYERLRSEDKQFISRQEQLRRAEQALAYVVRNHQALRTTRKRVGDAWDALDTDLRKFLLDVRVWRLEDLAETNDWAAAFALTRKLVNTYSTPEECAKIAQPLEDILRRALVSSDPGDARMRETRRRLRQIVERHPDSAIVRPIRDSLRGQAQALLDEAKRLGKDPKMARRALDLVDQAQEVFPELQGLRDYRVSLKQTHPILRIGVRALPVKLSPALATTDDELRATELLFEGLVKLSPDASGALRYHSGLAEGRPRVVAMGRQFQLPRGIKWSDGKTGLEAADIRYTLRQLAEGVSLGGPPAWVDQLLDEKVGGGTDPYQVTLSLKQGFLDSQAPMTVKIVPRDSRPSSPEFALKPISSGPFVFVPEHEKDNGRDYALFVANPIYGTRPGKSGLPHIQEVRFYVTAEPVKELLSGKLHMAFGLKPEEAAELRKSGKAQVAMPKPGASTNRRVWFLAMNHRRPALANADFRRALVHSIQREKLLDDCFRGPLGRDVHKSINGPFPAGSWPCSPRLAKGKAPNASLDLFDPDKAKTLATQARVRDLVGPKPLTLKYPDGDPAVEKAMNALKEQVKAATGIDLTLEKRDAAKLREDVEVTTSFDLAYYHYDYPDETYWLWPLLGPGRTGENYLGFKNGDVETAMRDAMGHREFARVQAYMHVLHEVVAHEVPIVPLWQLDPLVAWTPAVEPPPFDPLLVFTDAEQWRVEATD